MFVHVNVFHLCPFVLQYVLLVWKFSLGCVSRLVLDYSFVSLLETLKLP
jgi:hypothetical protein